MSRECSSLSPNCVQHELHLRHPAKRQRLSPNPECLPCNDLKSSGSSEEQTCIPLAKNISSDCGLNSAWEATSTCDEIGLDQTLLQRSGFTIQHQSTSGSPYTHNGVPTTNSAGIEPGCDSNPGETLAQFRPAAIQPSLSTHESWSTYLEPTAAFEGDSILCIDDGGPSDGQDLFRNASQHEPTINAHDTDLVLEQIQNECQLEEVNATVESVHLERSDSKSDVCFGMIPDIAASYERLEPGELPGSFTVHLDSSSRFRSTKHDFILGYIQHDYCQMLESLLGEEDLTLHVVCVGADRAPAKKKGRSTNLQPCTLELSVYGPIDMFEEIGSWFQEYEIYLQDPRICHLEAKYCNPHRLSSDNLDSSPMVSEVVHKTLVLTPKEVPERHDFLDILSSHVDLAETPQPSAIRATLKSHQKKALTFMLNREEGWGFKSKQPDVWEILETDHGRMFLNTISHNCQPEEPPTFSGGIIADPMGLGKTLTMIALVATDLNTAQDNFAQMNVEEIDKRDVSATLVIIPPPLLSTWEEQLSDHVVPGALAFRRHHGKNKLAITDDINSLNIVLTTYHTVSAEWKAEKSSGKYSLFSVRWRRIILDEAHFIRNGNSRMARAVCALDSISRWAVTGTPIQNRLGDLSSLLKFIRAHPYTDQKRFDNDISRLWKSGEVETAVKRIKRLSACLLLRRAKSTINLPPRRDLFYDVDFTPEERVAYEEIRQQAIMKIDEALGDQLGTSKSHVYVNVLQQIESLRLFCNLGLNYRSRHDKLPNQSSEQEEWTRNAQHTFNSQREMAAPTCLQCSSTLGLTDALLEDTAPSATFAQYTSCLKYICHDCVEKLNQGGFTIECGHTPRCFSSAVSTSTAALEEVGDLITPQLRMHSLSLPSKIRALVEDIKRSPSDVKCIVFSTWRLTLDLIKAGLQEASIPNVRFDGKVPQKDRQSVVNKFKSDPTVKVMLLTLSCGAVGLTLVAASRAYLMEPHWNPTLEEQALARIHRLGQTQEVTTVRLFVRNSFEEEVRKIQESKNQLAGVLLSPHDNGQSDNNLGALERLRSLL